MKKRLQLLLCMITILVSSTLILSVVQASSSSSYSYLFFSCDADGKHKTTFQLDDNVYLKGGYFTGVQQVTIYVLPNGAPRDPNYAVSDATQTITAYTLPVTLIWHASLTPGKYDVWIDVNQNGKYDCGDRLHWICCCYQFLVVPEYLIGSIGALAAMLASLAIFRQRKKAGYPKVP